MNQEIEKNVNGSQVIPLNIVNAATSTLPNKQASLYSSGLLDGTNFKMVSFLDYPTDTLVGAVDLVGATQPNSALSLTAKQTMSRQQSNTLVQQDQKQNKVKEKDESGDYS